MKDVPTKDQAEISGSGGTKEIGTCIPPAIPPLGPDVTVPPDDTGLGVESGCSTMERK